MSRAFDKFRRVAAVGVSLAMFAGAAAADSGLKRLTLRADGLGWEAVGRLDFSDGYCSGVLIATDLVLTAAHCVYDRAAGRMRAIDKLRFRAGLDDGSTIAEEPALRAVIDPAYADPATKRLDQIAVDVALVQLAQPIPAATAAPFDVGPEPAQGDTVAVVSYARGRSDAQSWQEACSVKARQGPLIGVTCNLDHGSSGAPIFSGGLDARPSIVSIVSSGGSTTEGAHIVIGMALPTLVARLKADLESGQGLIATAGPPGGTGPRPLSMNVSAGAKFVRP